MASVPSRLLYLFELQNKEIMSCSPQDADKKTQNIHDNSYDNHHHLVVDAINLQNLNTKVGFMASKSCWKMTLWATTFRWSPKTKTDPGPKDSVGSHTTIPTRWVLFRADGLERCMLSCRGTLSSQGPSRESKKAQRNISLFRISSMDQMGTDAKKLSSSGPTLRS